MMPGNIGQIKQMMQMVRSAGNPGAMVQEMAQNNPQMKQAMDFIKQNGNDPKGSELAAGPGSVNVTR